MAIFAITGVLASTSPSIEIGSGGSVAMRSALPTNSCVVACRAESLSALAIQFVAPESLGFFLSISFLVGIVVGGLASVYGAVFGAFFALWGRGVENNVYAQIGLVMLVGLAAKNGILIVEFANQLRDSGRDIPTAIREAAARRLRPILMTSIATVAGAVPDAMEFVVGVEALR